MTEGMDHAITKAKVVHEYELIRSWRDGFGLFWYLVRCPVCERVIQYGRHTVIEHNEGTMYPTAEDVDKMTAMIQAGQYDEARKLCASFPRHRFGTFGFELKLH